jgi:predicted metal-dependent HD superfamily phosphohydrolase
MPDLERWRATWTGLGIRAPDDRLYAEVVARYSEPHRRYHTTLQLDECFARLDEAWSAADQFYEVELALWFHDAVYEVRNQDNEERSASWAHAAAAQSGLPIAVAERVHGLILATKHDASPPTRDAALLVDVDLAILGAPVERFDEYERQVREEYSWVPGFLFRRKRREILEAFLARPHVYSTEYFRASYEAPARANLARSIRLLGG